MYGRYWLVEEATLMTLEIASWARDELGRELHIREQLIGLSADVVSPYLHQRLRGGFELPDWETAIFAPEQVTGAKFINRVGLPGCGCATIIPFAGGELELSREGNNAIGTLYSFERSFQEGVALLGGLGMERLSGIAFWFGKRSAEVAVTFEEYLRMIATGVLSAAIGT